MAILAQETGHQIMGANHTQCYHHDDGTPIEACAQTGCYTLPRLQQSDRRRGTGGAYPSLRVGPPRGEMCRVGRRNIIGFSTGCQWLDQGHIVYTLPDGYEQDDQDGDTFPDIIDNCPGKANPEQIDSNLDGRGDDYTYCAISAPGPGVAHTAWPLLLPVAALVWRRRRWYARFRGRAADAPAARRSIMSRIAVAIFVLAALARPVPAQVIGDCNGNGCVSIDELITGVGVALGEVPVSVCEAINCDTGPILPPITCMIEAINATLFGCTDQQPCGIDCGPDDCGGNCAEFPGTVVNGQQYICALSLCHPEDQAHVDRCVAPYIGTRCTRVGAP